MSIRRLGCACPNSASCLWTDPASSYVELVRAPKSAIKYEWRCSRCKTPSSKFVGSLWKTTVMSSHYTPACELGCPYGVSHFGGVCGRPIPASENMFVDKEVRVSLYKGPDFVHVLSTKLRSVVYLSLFVTEMDALFSPPISFRIGVCIWPATTPGSVIPASHRTRVSIGGAECPEGKLPMAFYIDCDKSVIMDQAALESGVVANAFLSRSSQFWRAVFSSACSLRRHGSILHGHTHNGYVPWCGGPVIDTPDFPTPCPAVPNAACEMNESGLFRCVYCNKTHQTDRDYHCSCCPELDFEHVRDFCNLLRGKFAVPNKV